jgi:energy-coupling factor transporter ATP-binding protein EcfA2
VPVVEIKGLSFTYLGADTPSLLNVDLEVEKGEYVVVAGPSGCGKSTLCRCLNGLVPHFYEGKYSGEVVVEGKRVADHGVPELSQRVGMVFQDPESQLFSLTVEGEVAFGPENIGLPREEIIKRVRDSLDRAEIAHLRDRMPFEISGGEQQRVAVAATLAMLPETLVLDEPTSNLDPQGAFTLLKLVGELNKDAGKTVIMVEHRLEAVAGFADRVVLMDKGRIVANGEPRSVLSSEVAASLGVGVPKIMVLAKSLESDGHRVDSSYPLTVGEGVHFVSEFLS